LITKKGRNSRGWNSSVAVKGSTAQTRVKMVGQRGLTTTIKYLDGLVGASQPNGIDKNNIIASYWRRRYVRGNSQVKKAVMVLYVAVGHGLASVWMERGEWHGWDRARPPRSS
jgi:hypothetical protein